MHPNGDPKQTFVSPQPSYTSICSGGGVVFGTVGGVGGVAVPSGFGITIKMGD